MNWLRLLPLIILGLANLILGVLVLARDYRRFNNIAFAGLSFFIGVWIIGIVGFFLSGDTGQTVLWAQLFYGATLLIAVFGMLFALSFPASGAKNPAALIPLLGGFFALSIPLAIHKSYLITGVIHHPWGKEIVLNHVGYLLYSIYIIVFFTAILVIMHTKSRRLDRIYALQARLFFKSLAVTAVFALLFNLILPLFGNYRWIGLGPLFTSISVIALGYAIIRHRMFDIRLVVARSLGYLFSLVGLASIYGFIVFGTAQVIFGLHFAILTQVLLSGATGVAALSFSRLKRIFDKWTNQIFYRDAYDPQNLFDKLNRVLVSTLDLDKLLRQVTTLLVSEMKSQFTLVGLKEVAGRPQRIIGTQQLQIDFKDIMKLRKLTIRYHQSVIVTDDLEDVRYQEMKQLLAKYDIAILVRLAPNLVRNEEGLGYLALGPKKSGNPYTRQDYRVLDTIANELIIAVQNALHFEEIQNFNKTLQDKVVDATRELRRTNEKLKALDETKDDFISMASHQLRTPLTSVKGYVSMVLDGDAGKLTTMERKMLTQAFISSQRMVYLISDLLNVSRLKTGKFVIERAPVNLADMISDEIAQLRETALTRDLKLEYDKPKSFPSLALDETKTRQVVMNFIDNAIYYTPAGGHIRVELKELPTTVELKVVDDGIGVPKAEQHHLFTKFYRAGNARKARPDGTGLGLFMARKVVIAEGGSIIFESSESKGSTFGFSFPKVTDKAAQSDLKAS